jgi:hypothetical protein
MGDNDKQEKAKEENDETLTPREEKAYVLK